MVLIDSRTIASLLGKCMDKYCEKLLLFNQSNNIRFRFIMYTDIQGS